MVKKKRFHQSAKDRVAESRGMERALYRRKLADQEHYAGAEPRRRQEMEDAGMIHEDHMEVANLPQGVQYRPWPKAGYHLNDNLDDTIRGIDEQMDEDGSEARRHYAPHKW